MSLRSLRVTAIVIATLSALSAVSSASAQESTAVGPGGTARFVEIAATLPAVEAYGLAVDSVTHRAFTHDVRNRAVRAFDTSGGSLTFLNAVDVGDVQGRQHGLSINESEHELYLLGRGSAGDELVVVHADPAAPATSTRFPLGTGGAFRVGVDEASHRVIVLNSRAPHVEMLDLDDGSTVSVDTGAVPTSVIVDPASQTVYVASADDSSIQSIRPDGSRTRTPLSSRPTALAVFRDQLLVATDSPSNHLMAYDTATMTIRTASTALAGRVIAITPDPDRHTIFATYDSLAGMGVEVLRSDTLSILGGAPAGGFGESAVDVVSHRLVVLRNGTGTKMTMLEPIVTPPPSVDRIGGADRYDVAAATSRAVFETGSAPVAYVASGAVYADALSGGAAAGERHGPILLVTKDRIPDVIAQELRRLRPSRIIVLGGEASVSVRVEGELTEFGVVSRIGGRDRYEVSAEISADTFPGGSRVAYLASGEVFPDALSASPLSGRENGPVLLTPRETLPGSVFTEIARLGAQYVYVLGGTATVSAAVVTEIEKTAAVIRIDGADRFAVSAAASERMFRPGTRTVFVASGEVFADALAGAPAAIAESSPVLLVRRDEIPGVIASEIERLDPYRIIVLGGSNTVSAAVAAELQSYLPD